MEPILNLNIGILGHVDSGKTTFAKALSTVESTASFDKSPESQNRGITLDLGFSATFIEDIPAPLNEFYERIQVTFVDCPGHASLMKSIIGGANIINTVILVVDATKGIQAQTAESLILAEYTAKSLIVILNKIDLIEENVRAAKLSKMAQKMKALLKKTKFCDSEIFPVSAASSLGIQDVLNEIPKHIEKPAVHSNEPFIFSVDHCFSIKGKGTIVTGTVLQGEVKVNETVEFPGLGQTKKIKSMQMFHKSVNRVKKGDRAGLCVAGFDAKLMERGLIADLNAVITVEAFICRIRKIPYFKQPISSGGRFHITFGHQTVMGDLHLFRPDENSNDFKPFVDASPLNDTVKAVGFSHRQDYPFVEQVQESSSNDYLCLMKLLHPVIVPRDSLFIGSRLDIDHHKGQCRLGFTGRIIETVKTNEIWPAKIFRLKRREGVVDRVSNQSTVIVKDLFSKDSDPSFFVGKIAIFETSQGPVQGIVQGPFGKTGKMSVFLSTGGDKVSQGDSVSITFKKYLFTKPISS